jgi:hypothetical protein
LIILKNMSKSERAGEGKYKIGGRGEGEGMGDQTPLKIKKNYMRKLV